MVIRPRDNGSRREGELKLSRAVHESRVNSEGRGGSRYCEAPKTTL